MDLEESLNSGKNAKLSNKSQQNNVLDKQAERMMNNTRLLKDDLNAMHIKSSLTNEIKRNNTKEVRNNLKFHTKLQAKIETNM